MSAGWKARPEGGARFALWLLVSIGRHGANRAPPSGRAFQPALMLQPRRWR